ncbi:MAG: hypothetical protein DHS20C08_16800 [Rhodomicrobium sp.]|nr:MAG: hypothetical protein DHS20C08_16800 [Rhodomicrobium sp.]
MKENEFPSTIRYSLYAGLLIILTILVLSVISSIWGLKRSAHFLERANYSYGQLAKVSSIEAKINQYLLSEIATTVNFQNRDQLIKANPALITQALGELQSSIELEMDFIKKRGGRDDIGEELGTAVNIASVFIRMHLAARYEGKRRANMDRVDAVRAFYANVVEGNDKQLSQVVRDIAEGEQEEVNEIKQEIETLTTTITWASATLAFITTLGIISLAFFLTRSIVGPVESLALGAEQIGSGNLAHRIELPREDEFGLVANRFNKMARQLEEQQNLLRSHNERLEQAVSKRTSQLKESNERLTQIDETRRKFFSNVSHELRTPVTVLLGEAEVALRSSKATLADMKEAMGRVVANGGFLRRRLNDLLNLARSDDGEIRLNMEEAVLNELVEEAVETAAAYAEANDVKLKFSAENEDFIAMLDPSWFKQCILVLIDNAVKFSKPSDLVTVSVCEEAGTEDPETGRKQSYAHIRVIDEGPGIEAEALPHLFERFYQSVEGQKREGTGLGLAIAHWIVEGHEGQIWAENGDEKGAIIHIKVRLI